MTNSKEIILKEGGLTYSGGSFNPQSWSLREIEQKNFFLVGLIFGDKNSRRSRRRVFLEPVHCVITDKRFIFGKRKDLNEIAVGKPVNLTKGGKFVGIPLANIVNIDITREGNKLIVGEFIVETKDSLYKLLVKNPNEWKDAFNEAIAKQEAEEVPVNYCQKCGMQDDDSLEICPCCGFPKKGESPVSEKTKSYITKMWLYGLLGTLGFHFYASGRWQRGIMRTVCGIAIWFLFIVFLYGNTEAGELTRLAIATGVLLFILPVVELIMIRIGKFKDVYLKYVK